MNPFPEDIFTEQDGDPDTLANLGPLRRLAGVWEGRKGVDLNPKADGPERREFLERIELQPIDPQSNGPQLLYGLRYHIHILTEEEDITFHDQVGYWLWEPAARTVIHMLAIPRGQVLLAVGPAEPDATEFEVSATRGSEVNGILSNPFLDRAFQTVSFRMRVSVHDNDTWSYEEHTSLRMPDRQGLVDHVDRNTLTRVGDPAPNPLAR